MAIKSSILFLLESFRRDEAFRICIEKRLIFGGNILDQAQVRARRRFFRTYFLKSNKMKEEYHFKEDI